MICLETVLGVPQRRATHRQCALQPRLPQGDVTVRSRSDYAGCTEPANGARGCRRLINLYGLRRYSTFRCEPSNK